MADALVLPLTAAVPKEYAEKYDKNKPSNYANYQVATGPYMLKNNAEGKVLGIGYVPGKSATLVRNPNWNAKHRLPPRLPERNRDQDRRHATSVIGRQVLEGTNVVENEPAGAVDRQARGRKLQEPAGDLTGRRQPLHRASTTRLGHSTTSTCARPSGRRSTARRWTGRAAARLSRTSRRTSSTRRSPASNRPAASTGPKVDYNEHPEGNMTVAEKYMKLAGYPSGKYTGGEDDHRSSARGQPDRNRKTPKSSTRR